MALQLAQGSQYALLGHLDLSVPQQQMPLIEDETRSQYDRDLLLAPDLSVLKFSATKERTFVRTLRKQLAVTSDSLNSAPEPCSALPLV
jgi:hypothetical protein